MKSVFSKFSMSTNHQTRNHFPSCQVLLSFPTERREKPDWRCRRGAARAAGAAFAKALSGCGVNMRNSVKRQKEDDLWSDCF